MTLLGPALAAGASQAPRTPRATRTATLVGAGGALGSAMLEALLASGCFGRVQAVVTAPIAPALRGLETVRLEALPTADTAFIVFDRERAANGREAAFLRAAPQELAPIAAALQAAGARHLLVVLPHAPSLLPQALKRGLASLDEQAVSAMGFEHVVIVRSAQSTRERHTHRLQRLAAWMLSQLHFMVPQQEQPVRAPVLAAFVVQLARRLPEAAAGTLIVPPELVWQAAQQRDLDGLARAWLESGVVPERPVTPRRGWR